MCRFVLYQGPPLTIASLVTEPEHSIINQSYKALETEEPLNGDGFGVAWYVPELSERPGVFRSVSPAWSNANLLDLARITKSHCVLAHVRAATPGLPVAEINCHPFASGRYCFMHNGDIARFQQIRRRLLSDLTDDAFNAIRGVTDSEHLFGVFLDEIHDAESNDGVEEGAALARGLERAVGRVVALVREAKAHLPPPPGSEDECYINVAVSDGRCSAACRFATVPEPSSLYYHTGRRYVCDGGSCRMIEPEAGHGAVIVSSERLSEDPGWSKVPPNHVVVVRKNNTAHVRPMDVEYAL